LTRQQGVVARPCFRAAHQGHRPHLRERRHRRSIRVIDTAADEASIIRALKKDPTRNEEEALKEIYKRLRPGEPPTAANAKALLKRLFFDPKRYDLGRVGRYKVNQKLGLKVDLEQRILESGDVVAATKYLVRLKRGEGVVDDIDHLGSAPRPHRRRTPRQPVPRRPRPHRALGHASA
jgi:DNA-directed RNA polymerase subunit beta